jgi:[phosphatase 2A protein]-leucine-carboxy methyltransferase
VDFPDITKTKVSVIQENSDLKKLIFKDDEASYEGDNSILATSYKLIPCDIRDTDLLRDKLSEAGCDPTAATIVMTECVLCYMENCDSVNVLSFLPKYFSSNLAVVNFEMIKPNDPFGETMIENLEARGCQLLGLKDVPDEEAQINRMTE